jgi:hypothetical protein
MINTTGDRLTTAAVGLNRGLGKDSALFSNPELVLGACGAAVLYRRRMPDDNGFLDERSAMFYRSSIRIFYEDGWTDAKRPLIRQQTQNVPPVQ